MLESTIELLTNYFEQSSSTNQTNYDYTEFGTPYNEGYTEYNQSNPPYSDWPNGGVYPSEENSGN